MTTEWTELKDPEELFRQHKSGEYEIEYTESVACDFGPWFGRQWHKDFSYRSRPKKKTKTIVLREALMFGVDRTHWIDWREINTNHGAGFVRWLDTPAREIEVEDE